MSGILLDALMSERQATYGHRRHFYIISSGIPLDKVMNLAWAMIAREQVLLTCSRAIMRTKT